MKLFDWIVIGAFCLASLAGTLFLGPCIPKPYIIPPATVVTVVPTPLTPNVQHALPAGQTAHSQIVIPTPVQHPGVIPTQHVVPTDQGNTLVVTTYALDWGFKLDPQLVVGYDGDVFADLGVNFFRVWRLDASAVAGYGFQEKTIRLGAAVTYAVDNNVKVGATYQFATDGKGRLGVGVALSL